jgi:hypothetical protein
VRVRGPAAAALLGAMLMALGAAGVCALLLVLAISRGGGGPASVVGELGSPTAAYAPSAEARADIPPLYLELYMEAAARFGLDWTILAGIGRVECDHGQDPAPSCTVEGQLNYAGAGGPAQFLVSTWQRYGITPSGQGTPDMWNPADAIFSMANYLRASGAPANWRRAIYAYNHAWWYVADVLSWARRYRAQYGAAPATATPIGGVVRVAAAGPWLAPLPGTQVRCDARIIPDVEYILDHFGLRATSCYRDDGPADAGEHPLGLALDAVPADGNWSRALAAAEAFDWTPSCGATGCVGRLRPPMRFIGYNGYPGHGDPAHAGANAHIHFSWVHAPAAPYTEAAWVDVFEVPEAAVTTGPG